MLNRNGGEARLCICAVQEYSILLNPFSARNAGLVIASLDILEVMHILELGQLLNIGLIQLIGIGNICGGAIIKVSDEEADALIL